MTTTFQTVFAGQGEAPIKMVYMVTTDNLATITAAGYLNKYAAGNGYVFATKDVIFAFYGGIFGIFNVAISAAGVITLSLNADIPAGSIVNADISASAAIAYSKLATLATGSIVAGAAGVASALALSGDATIGATGVLTIASNAITTAKILAANVTLAKLATGITPSHVIKFAGRITWSGSGASLTTAVAGVLATDEVVATIRGVPTQAAYIATASTNTDQVIITLSAANTSNDAVITYEVLRAAA